MVKTVDNLSPWGYTYVYKIIKDDCVEWYRQIPFQMETSNYELKTFRSIKYRFCEQKHLSAICAGVFLFLTPLGDQLFCKEAFYGLRDDWKN